MLTIYLYKNVPLQEDNKNVLLFSNENDVLSYLSPFQDGVISNINKFFSNEKFIDLSLMYEGCNYMCIYDDRSVKEYKFFFIDNVYFVSGSTVRYEITLDVWATYSYNVTIKPSLLVGGHLDALVTNENLLKTKRNLRIELNGDNRFELTTPILNGWATFKNATVICTASRVEYKEQLFFCVQVATALDLNKALRNLQTNTFHDIDNNDYTFEIQKVYVINQFNLLNQLSTTMYRSVTIGTEMTPLDWKYVSFQSQVPFNAFIYSGYLFNDITMFADKTDKLKYEYFIGTLTTNEQLKVNSETQPYCKITINIMQRSQVAIYLECNGMKMNLTNDFEVPFMNDNYTLYMAQNQATIDASNRANSSQLAMSLATSMMMLGLSSVTGGASAMIGMSMLGSVENYAVKQDLLNAKLSDMRKQPNKTDALYSGGLMTLLNGVGLFRKRYSDISDVEEDLNENGTIFTYITDTFVTPRNDINFYFLQFNNVNVQGYFTNSIKTKFETIFNNGVRIWKDKTNFLNHISYK